MRRMQLKTNQIRTKILINRRPSSRKSKPITLNQNNKLNKNIGTASSGGNMTSPWCEAQPGLNKLGTLAQVLLVRG